MTGESGSLLWKILMLLVSTENSGNASFDSKKVTRVGQILFSEKANCKNIVFIFVI